MLVVVSLSSSELRGGVRVSGGCFVVGLLMLLLKLRLRFVFVF